jgi:hypothetical protein
MKRNTSILFTILMISLGACQNNSNGTVSTGQEFLWDLSDGKSYSYTMTQTGTAVDTMKTNLPSTSMDGMAANGQLSDKQGQIFFGLLLPLPSMALEAGNRDTLHIETPVSIANSRLISHGVKSMLFQEIKTIDGRKCAVFQSALTTERITVPDELPGQYNYIETATGTHYFDLENGHYISTDIVVKRVNEMSNTEAQMQTSIKNDFTYHLEYNP